MLREAEIEILIREHAVVIGLKIKDIALLNMFMSYDSHVKVKLLREFPFQVRTSEIRTLLMQMISSLETVSLLLLSLSSITYTHAA